MRVNPLLRSAALVLFFASAALSLAATAADTATPKSLPASAAIFNGKDFTGWTAPTLSPFWRIEHGVLIGENDEALKGSMLWTEQSYGDLVMELEARWHGEIDSGVMLRKPNLQLQIGISRSQKRDLTGSFYIGGKDPYPEAGQTTSLAKVLKPDDWNTFRLEARGTTFTVWMNGEKTVAYTDAKYAAPGPLGLQIHPNLKMKVEFRNVRVAALK